MYVSPELIKGAVFNDVPPAAPVGDAIAKDASTNSSITAPNLPHQSGSFTDRDHARERSHTVHVAPNVEQFLERVDEGVLGC